jgi:NitT/TauT family transport system ATP-binding protein
LGWKDLHALAPGAPVPRRVLLDTLAADVAPFEAERQLDTAVNWGRWAQLFDYDADDGWFLPAPDNEVAR